MSKLLNAVFENDVAKVEELLARDPRHLGDQDAFCQAIGWGRRESAILLMDRGADLNKKDSNGNTPLLMACLSLDADLFGELVRRGSRMDDAADLAATAASSGHEEILRVLHEHKVDLNQTGTRGRPIDAAIGTGNIAVVDYLLSLGVDISHVDVTTPLKPWKGAIAEPDTMEEIRKLIENAKLEASQR